jgi:hypothetical protein
MMMLMLISLRARIALLFLMRARGRYATICAVSTTA